VAIGGPTTVKPKVYCEWIAVPSGGMSELTYQWWIGGQLVGTGYLGLSTKAPSCVLLGG
jgi:hypothetical protein